jgi:hypothetical protein
VVLASVVPASVVPANVVSAGKDRPGIDRHGSPGQFPRPRPAPPFMDLRSTENVPPASPDVRARSQGGGLAGAHAPLSQPALFQTHIPSNPYRPQYDVSRDGRFLADTESEITSIEPIHLLLNWKPPANQGLTLRRGCLMIEARAAQGSRSDKKLGDYQRDRSRAARGEIASGARFPIPVFIG